MKKLIYTILVLLMFLIMGCEEELKETITNEECQKDSDCKITGCNGEICSKEQLMSICIYKPEFECYKLINCKCTDGKCGWEKTDEFNECLRKNQ
jgi:eight-cysteine-cluster-containing protein